VFCVLCFDDWWTEVNVVDDQTKKGLNSLIILGAWSIWKRSNRCVFDGLQPRIDVVLHLLGEELHLWSRAGPRGVSHLLALEPSGT
jgi:hypothetical protein